MKLKKTKRIILIFILILFISYLTYRGIIKYQYHHYWNQKTDFLSVTYSSEDQILRLNTENDFVQNKQNGYGEFLTGQWLYNDGLTFSLEIYRKPSNMIACVVSLELTKEADLEYQYELSIFHNTNYTLMDKSFKIESVDLSTNKINLLKESECSLQSFQQYGFQCAEIKFWNYALKRDEKARATYIIEFYVNYDGERPTGNIKAKFDIIAKNKYKLLSTLEVNRSIYLLPWK